MAQTYPVFLLGGPCANTVHQLTATQLRNGRYWCKGQLYVNTGYGAGDYKYAFQLNSDYLKANKPSSVLSAMHAWSRLMHILAHKGPDAHRRTVMVANRARRIAR